MNGAKGLAGVTMFVDVNFKNHFVVGFLQVLFLFIEFIYLLEGVFWDGGGGGRWEEGVGKEEEGHEVGVRLFEEIESTLQVDGGIDGFEEHNILYYRPKLFLKGGRRRKKGGDMGAYTVR